ncbi:MAG: hypothetical protein WC045_01685 [Patescibacteria group bacterium]
MLQFIKNIIFGPKRFAYALRFLWKNRKLSRQKLRRLREKNKEVAEELKKKEKPILFFLRATKLLLISLYRPWRCYYWAANITGQFREKTPPGMFEAATIQSPDYFLEKFPELGSEIDLDLSNMTSHMFFVNDLLFGRLFSRYDMIILVEPVIRVKAGKDQTHRESFYRDLVLELVKRGNQWTILWNTHPLETKDATEPVAPHLKPELILHAL